MLKSFNRLFLEETDKLRLSFQNTEEKFQKKILNERIARLSGGIAILQVTQRLLELESGYSGVFELSFPSILMNLMV